MLSFLSKKAIQGRRTILERISSFFPDFFDGDATSYNRAPNNGDASSPAQLSRHNSLAAPFEQEEEKSSHGNFRGNSSARTGSSLRYLPFLLSVALGSTYAFGSGEEPACEGKEGENVPYERDVLAKRAFIV